MPASLASHTSRGHRCVWRPISAARAAGALDAGRRGVRLALALVLAEAGRSGGAGCDAGLHHDRKEVRWDGWALGMPGLEGGARPSSAVAGPQGGHLRQQVRPNRPNGNEYR
eukprot:gene12344-biopygen8499